MFCVFGKQSCFVIVRYGMTLTIWVEGMTCSMFISMFNYKCLMLTCKGSLKSKEQLATRMQITWVQLYFCYVMIHQIVYQAYCGFMQELV